MPRSPHTLLTWSGVLGDIAAPSEEWSFGLRASGGVTSFSGNLVSAATAMAAAFSDNIAPLIGDNVRLTECAVATVTGDGTWGKDADGQYLVGRYNTNVPGAVNNKGIMPPQTALCVSLNTARSGPTGKGRFFLPLGRITLGADGRLTAIDAGLFADGARELINDINTIVGQVVVASETGTLSPVTSVRVGRACDTLRSRRRSIVEEYQFRALPT